jgi:hypothetical protein
VNVALRPSDKFSDALYTTVNVLVCVSLPSCSLVLSLAYFFLLWIRYGFQALMYICVWFVAPSEIWIISFIFIAILSFTVGSGFLAYGLTLLTILQPVTRRHRTILCCCNDSRGEDGCGGWLDACSRVLCCDQIEDNHIAAATFSPGERRTAAPGMHVVSQPISATVAPEDWAPAQRTTPAHARSNTAAGSMRDRIVTDATGFADVEVGHSGVDGLSGSINSSGGPSSRASAVEDDTPDVAPSNYITPAGVKHRSESCDEDDVVSPAATAVAIASPAVIRTQPNAGAQALRTPSAQPDSAAAGAPTPSSSAADSLREPLMSYTGDDMLNSTPGQGATAPAAPVTHPETEAHRDLRILNRKIRNIRLVCIFLCGLCVFVLSCVVLLCNAYVYLVLHCRSESCVLCALCFARQFCFIRRTQKCVAAQIRLTVSPKFCGFCSLSITSSLRSAAVLWWCGHCTSKA